MRYHLILGNKANSSWSLRGWLLFEPFGIEFDHEVVPLYVPDYKKFLEANNPATTAPALVVNDGTEKSIMARKRSEREVSVANRD